MSRIARSRRPHRIFRLALGVVAAGLLVASCQLLGPVGSLPVAKSPTHSRKPAQMPTTTPTAAPWTPAAVSVRVVGNHLVDAHGTTVRLLGVNQPGMDVETATGECWWMPADVSAIDAMLGWHINAVRIPLNEDCWLGINGVNPTTTAPAYRAGLHSYVRLLHKHGLYAILDLHRSAPGPIPATFMQAMPDADHAPAFWSSMASSFLHDKAVVFDLYNEPHLSDVLPEGADYWKCWLSGCTIPVVYSTTSGAQQPSPHLWRAVGMQQLVNAVRSTGATQPVMLSGLNYANGLIGWLSHTPIDQAHQVIASAHVYNESVGCVDLRCWQQQLAPIARQYPVVTGEFGENDCGHGFMDRYMQFADANGISYLGWSWSLETNCRSQANMGLITNWSGTPSSSGIGLRDHLTALTP